MKVDLDRLEIEAPASPERQRIAFALLVVGLVTILAALFMGVTVDTERTRQHEYEEADRLRLLSQRARLMDGPVIEKVPHIPVLVEEWLVLRKDTSWTLALRNADMLQPDIASIPDDREFLDAMNQLTAELSWLHTTQVPLRPDPTRPFSVVDEQAEWRAGRPNRLVDAIHDQAEREAARAARLHWYPAVSQQSMWESRATWTQRGRAASTGVDPLELPHPLVPEAAPMPASVLPRFAGGGAVAALLAWLFAWSLLGRRSVQITSEGLVLNGRRVPTASIGPIKRVGDGLRVPLPDGTLELPGLGHVLANRVMQTLQSPLDDAPRAPEPVALKRLRKASRDADS